MSEPRKIWYKLRGALIVPFYVFIIFSCYEETKHTWLTIPLGGALFGIGWFLRIWAQTHLHYRLKAHKKLTLSGPYVYVRNPIYIGNTFILAGLTVMAKLIWFVPVMVVACAFTYHMTVLYEEGHLARKYGQGYVNFLRSVPRWMPRFSGQNPDPEGTFFRYLFPSIFAELHILLLLLPVIIVEYFNLKELMPFI